MKLTAKVRLQTTPAQHQALLETLERANAACDQISEVAWQNRVFNQFKLHGLTYYSIRSTSGLSAQMTVRCISKVTDAYKLDKETKRTFNPHGSIAYDDRILKWYVNRQTVSIWTTQGRLTIPFLAGQRQLDLLQHQHGESDLGLVDGVFYIFATCEKETPEPVDVEGVLGIDLGIVNVATTSDGETYAGNRVNNVRHRHRRLRKKLQAKQTKSAKRRLKKLSGKEARFVTDVNHVISKSIVAKAQGTNRAIALEKLTGIRDRVRLRKPQRATLHSWSFYQLKGFISYKAQLAGIPLIEVDPRNTSRTCPACGWVDKANRKSQSSFLCTQCGCAGLADYFASIEIGRRAAVNRPNVSTPLAISSFNRSMAMVG
jgi:putative transposase